MSRSSAIPFVLTFLCLIGAQSFSDTKSLKAATSWAAMEKIVDKCQSGKEVFQLRSSIVKMCSSGSSRTQDLIALGITDLWCRRLSDKGLAIGSDSDVIAVAYTHTVNPESSLYRATLSDDIALLSALVWRYVYASVLREPDLPAPERKLVGWTKVRDSNGKVIKNQNGQDASYPIYDTISDKPLEGRLKAISAKVVRISPNSAEARYLGALQKKDDNREAWLEIRAALQLKPNASWRHEALASMAYRADLLHSKSLKGATKSLANTLLSNEKSDFRRRLAMLTPYLEANPADR